MVHRPPVQSVSWRRRAARAATALLVLAAGAAASRVGAGAPTLATITIDGNMGDWAAVLADPDNLYLDGPAGGLPDADSPSSSALDVDTFAYTWDAANLYFYLHRQASSSPLLYYWYFIDADNDGFMESGEPVVRIRWRGSNGATSVRLDTYSAADAILGDPIDAAGVHDGYTLPGTTINGPAIGNPRGGSADGLSVEAAVPWAVLGLFPGSAVTVHVASTASQGVLPTGVEDNLGGDNLYADLIFDPDRAATTTPGTVAVFAHTLTNNGNGAEVVDLTWTSAGGFTPVSVDFYADLDGSGTLTAGDVALGDTDGDGDPDTGPIAGMGAATSVLVAITTPAGSPVGSTATVIARAVSSNDPAVSDAVADAVTLSGPTLTLLKLADKGSALPGETITYTVTYTNAGDMDAQNVTLTDAAPAPAVYVAGSAAGAGMTITFSHDGGATFDASEAPPVTHVRWELAGALAPAVSGTVSFAVQVP